MSASSYTDNWISSTGDVSFAPTTGSCGCVSFPALFTVDYLSKALNSFEFNTRLLNIAKVENTTSDTFLCFTEAGSCYLFDGFSIVEYIEGQHAAFLSNKKKLIIFHETGVFSKPCPFPQPPGSIIMPPSRLKQYMITIAVQYQNTNLPRSSDLDLLSSVLELENPNTILTSLKQLMPSLCVSDAIKIMGCHMRQRTQATQTMYLAFMLYCIAHYLLKERTTATINELCSASKIIVGKTIEEEVIIEILSSQSRFNIIDNKVMLKPKTMF
jgi:hypothetical protein